MKKIGIQQLRKDLTATFRDVEAGTTVAITRHNLPAAVLMPESLFQDLGDAASRCGLRIDGGSLVPLSMIDTNPWRCKQCGAETTYRSGEGLCFSCDPSPLLANMAAT